MPQAAHRDSYRRFLRAFAHPDPAGADAAIAAFLDPDCNAHAVHPINAMPGARGYRDALIAPLRAAFEGLYRREDIVIAGRGYDGGEWVSSTGYFVGRFTGPLFGIAPSHKLAYLRVGEFHRIASGRSVEAYIYLDLPELMIRTGQWPLGAPQGYAGHIPGPATQDGLAGHDSARSATTMALIETMLAGLATEDEAWRPYWHQNMMWYGPGAFGSFVGIEAFRDFQVPFEAAFEGWGGGMSPRTPTRHFTRFSEGDYGCIGGWPSLQGTHTGSYLGFAPTGVTTNFRVCDWYRREGNLLVENWVFVDIPHALLQWDYDVLAAAQKRQS